MCLRRPPTKKLWTATWKGISHRPSSRALFSKVSFSYSACIILFCVPTQRVNPSAPRAKEHLFARREKRLTWQMFFKSFLVSARRWERCDRQRLRPLLCRSNERLTYVICRTDRTKAHPAMHRSVESAFFFRFSLLASSSIFYGRRSVEWCSKSREKQKRSAKTTGQEVRICFVFWWW